MKQDKIPQIVHLSAVLSLQWCFKT